MYTVYAPILLAPRTVLIKCSDFQRSLLARSISDPSVLTTKGAYVFIFSLCCLLSVCNVFTTPRAGPQSRPLPLVYWSAPPDNPQGIRVASVIEFSVCLSVCLS